MDEKTLQNYIDQWSANYSYDDYWNGSDVVLSAPCVHAPHMLGPASVFWVCFWGLVLTLFVNGVVMFVLLKDWVNLIASDVMMLGLCIYNILCVACMLLGSALHITHYVEGLMCYVQILFESLTLYSGAWMVGFTGMYRCALVLFPKKEGIKKRCLGWWFIVLSFIFGVLLAIDELISTKRLDVVVIGGKDVSVCAMVGYGPDRARVYVVQSLFGILIPVIMIFVCFLILVWSVTKLKLKKKCRVYGSFLAGLMLFMLMCAPYNVALMIDGFMRLGMVVDTCEGRTLLDLLLQLFNGARAMYCIIATLVMSLCGSVFKTRLVRQLQRCQVSWPEDSLTSAV
ncbi:G-protein coupled receptor [Cricetid gammaherpesvirus 2]|uniref:G-protein coupled receptor n=1 Tax=Cricetid gammaherpesvirus 2 TaxID=1605972 RepID=E9M5Q7_9GAMA|nr:G-protein coupled receptor [Cricetid gammaherpesvirus 2]ADW24415.1 G-protein coupled receptor [Cricetid gammaherpesvirus 2]ADW24497.1 G-protein coupled receptor [Cricetid gammaherpesvirus 2]